MTDFEDLTCDAIALSTQFSNIPPQLQARSYWSVCLGGNFVSVLFLVSENSRSMAARFSQRESRASDVVINPDSNSHLKRNPMIGKINSAPPALSLQWQGTQKSDDKTKLVFVKSITGLHSVHRMFNAPEKAPAFGNGGNPLFRFAKAVESEKSQPSQQQSTNTEVSQPRLALTSMVQSIPAQIAVLSQSPLQRHEAHAGSAVPVMTLPASTPSAEPQTAVLSQTPPKAIFKWVATSTKATEELNKYIDPFKTGASKLSNKVHGGLQSFNQLTTTLQENKNSNELPEKIKRGFRRLYNKS